MLLGLSAPAFARTKSEPQSVWRIVGTTVHVAFTIPEIELPAVLVALRLYWFVSRGYSVA